MNISSLPSIKKGAVYVINGKRLTYVGAESRYTYLRNSGRDNPENYNVMLHTFKDARDNEHYYHGDEDLEIVTPSDQNPEEDGSLVGVFLFVITISVVAYLLFGG